MDLSPANLERLNQNRLYQALGIRITTVGDGECQSEMRADPNVCWPVQGQPHGGIVATQIDTTMATAVMTVLDEPQRLSTINLDIQ